MNAGPLADPGRIFDGTEDPPSSWPRSPYAVLPALVVLPLSSAPFSPSAPGLTPAGLLALLAFGLVAVALAVGRAMLQAQAAARRASARAEQLESDIAKLQHAEQAAPNREERYRTPLDQVENYTIFLLDTSGKPTSWNPGIRRVLGYDKQEFLGMSAADLYASEHRQAGLPERDLADAGHGGGRVIVDRWLLRKDGSRFWASMSTAAVHDRHGQLLGFARRLRDLTEAKRVEHQLREKKQALELALEAAGLGTWEYDVATGEDHWDARAKMLFGLEPDRPVTQGAWVNAIHPEDRDRSLEGWETAVRGRAGYSAEYRVIWPDGTVHWLMAVGRCALDPATSEPIHFTGVVLDLTERRRAEERLQEGLRLEAIGRLAGGIAHDLNNMLGAILGFSEFLVRSFEPDDPRRSDVDQITHAADRSVSLTRQLLTFARRERIQPRALDLNAVVRHAEPMLPSILGENIELRLQLSPDVGVVYADSRQVEQTLMNLVLNARDAMPRGGRVTIETRTLPLEAGPAAWRDQEDDRPDGRFVMLSVADTGEGMDAATLARMWEPFFTTKAPGHGTGLGLSSVYGAVRQSGGFVWADSEPGRGTTVQVCWPEIRAEPEPIGEPAAPPEMETGTETVLIVEDEELVRLLAARTLTALGYTCLEAGDASAALRLLQDERVRVDLVITDVVMPGMSGGGLGDRLNLLRPGLPVLYTSAFTDEDVIRRGLLDAGRPFLQKPASPHALAHKVREVLDAVAAARGQHQAVP